MADIGVLTHRSYALPKSNTIKGRIISSDHTNTKFYLVYNNFDTLLKWNPSKYFALAVSLLTQEMRPEIVDDCYFSLRTGC